MLSSYNILFYAFLYAIFNVIGAAIIKNKLHTIKITEFQDFFSFLVDVRIVLALFFIFISMFFSIKALSLSSFSSVIPLMTAINFIITVIVGVIFFKDHLVMSSYLGIFFIMLGVIFISNGYAN